MRRFLFLALLVLVLPGCAAHKVTARDSFFSVSGIDGANVEISIADGFILYERESLTDKGSTLDVSVYRRGSEIVGVLVGAMPRGSNVSGEDASVELIMAQHESPFKYAITYRPSIPVVCDERKSPVHQSSGEMITQESGVLLKQYTYLFAATENKAVLVACRYMDMPFSLSFTYPEQGAPLTPEQQSMLEEFSKRADAAFKGIRFAQ